MKKEFPINDTAFEDTSLTTVHKESDGWSITRADGWNFWIPKDSPVEPKPGMSARFYGKGVGYAVRGVFLDGYKVYYRTAAEQKEHGANDLYGKDIHEWLRRWDEGKSVWSISMGGIGPGYEQAIQVLAVEVVRHYVNTKANWWEGTEAEQSAAWKAVRASCDPLVSRIDEHMGFSGAQVGAAISLASKLYRKGPRACMEDEAVKDRHILVSKEMPSLPVGWDRVAPAPAPAPAP